MHRTELVRCYTPGISQTPSVLSPCAFENFCWRCEPHAPQPYLNHRSQKLGQADLIVCSVLDTGTRATQPLARQLFHLGERRIDRAGASIGGILDHAVEPAVDVENGALA